MSPYVGLSFSIKEGLFRENKKKRLCTYSYFKCLIVLKWKVILRSENKQKTKQKTKASAATATTMSRLLTALALVSTTTTFFALGDEASHKVKKKD